MIELRAASPDDYDFLWGLHRTTLRDYVEAIWGWDEAWQADRFRAYFAPDRLQVIRYQGIDVGVVSVHEEDESLFLDYIAIQTDYQGRGIGSAVIQQVMRSAVAKGLPVTLRVLRGNPAKRLYERLGFVVWQETDERFFMIREADPM